MTWSATQYTKFEDERTRPVRDLIAGIPNTQAKRAVDIGCGPGNSTELLQQRFPGAAVSGLDNSADMIGAARKRLPTLHFETADISTWADPGPFDVILANAVLQWVPDHTVLFPALIAKLGPGGTLAVQVPNNASEPAHTAMQEIASTGPWAAKFAGDNVRFHRNDANWYWGLLRGRVTRLDIWRTTYFHPLGGVAAIVEWFKGSGLRPFLDRLAEGERADFLARYETKIAAAYPAFPDGTVLLPMPRLFIVATR